MEIESEWSDYGFHWLFSPDSSTTYLPVEEQIKQYKTRDLEKSKMYLMAAKLWGLGARSRRRIIIAPPMTDKPRRSTITTQANVPLNPPTQGVNKTKERTAKKGDDWALSEKEQQQVHEEELEERTVEYKHWLKERVKLREGLENLGLSENWLTRKNDLTPLEQRVCNKMEEDRKTKEEARMQRKTRFHWQTDKAPVEGGPEVSKPVPEGLVIIVQYLTRRRQRILDLFSRADKDKSWGISRSEFKHCIEEAGIHISDHLLNEVVDSLDTDGDDYVDYRELVAGVKDVRLAERRKAKSRQSGMSQVTVSIDAPDDSPTKTGSHQHQRESVSARLPSSGSPPIGASAAFRSASAMSDRTVTSSPTTSTSSQLPLPRIDVTERVEMMPDDMVEKRKKEKHLTAHRSKSQRKKRLDKIKTGNTAIDNHSLRSTLRGDIGGAVDRYREARLKEYHQICQLCTKNGVSLTPELLQKALLHPGDKPHKRIRTRIRQPGIQTISSHFADPPEPPESPSEYHDPEKIVISSTGQLLMEAKHAYPQKQQCSAEPELMNLSSGKAFVKRKVDCWMTFEDYERLTNHLGKRYVNISDGGSDPNAFWPGQLLDKVRLCMPSGRTSPSQCFFSTTKQQRPVNVGYTNNNLTWWPVSDTCYVKPADIEQRKKYSIDWK